MLHCVGDKLFCADASGISNREPADDNNSSNNSNDNPSFKPIRNGQQIVS